MKATFEKITKYSVNEKHTGYRNEFHVLQRPDVAIKTEASQFTEMGVLS